jgi:microcystin degradation protein MlrC
MRVGIIAFLQESNTFIDGVTVRRHFEEDLLIQGEAIRQRMAASAHEVGGFFAALEAEGIEAVPIFAARAYPFGVIEAATFDALVEALLAALRAAGPLDGVLAAPHGATVAENHADADGHWLAAVRAEIGPAVPLIATLDAHANLSAQMVAATDALIAYRTNPHLDQRETGMRAARLMARTLRGEIKLTQAAAFPPLAINIQVQNTSEAPLKAMYDWAAMLEADHQVLSQSIILGFPYADVPEMGSSVVVVTDADPALAQRLADAMAGDMWSRRLEFLPDFISPHQAVDTACDGVGRYLLLDMGDNVGGGAPAHGTILLEELHRRGVESAFVCLYDPGCVQIATAAGVGARLELQLGGARDGLHGEPVLATCEVLSLHEGKFQEPEARHGGFTEFDQGATAVVKTLRGVTVMLTSRRVPPFSLEQLRSCGLDPLSFRILVAKGVIAPQAAYGPMVDHILLVNTPGVTCADMTLLPFHLRRKPMFPFEPEVPWIAGSCGGSGAGPLGIPLQVGAGDDRGPIPNPNPTPLCPAK